MFQTQTKPSTKVLPIMLKTLDDLLDTTRRLRRDYKNENTEYISFVARLISQPDQDLVFTDETGVLRYNHPVERFRGPLVQNSYYQCLCTLKTEDKIFKLVIANMKEVDGNVLTTHLARVAEIGL